MRKLVWILCTAAALSGLAIADDDHHHEELTQDQLGTVHFPVSCSPEAQKAFENGVALLHSFWYEEAQKTFEQVEKQDPTCAMAYWGEAISLWHKLWDEPKEDIIKRASAELKQADNLKASDTERERDYIQALETFYSG